MPLLFPGLFTDFRIQISNIVNLNTVSLKKVSVFLLITVIGAITLAYNSILGEYIQKNLGVLFNSY